MDEIDHQYTDEIVCPYCGFKHDPTDYLPDEQCDTEECSECGRTYEYHASIDITWCTAKVKEGGGA